MEFSQQRHEIKSEWSLIYTEGSQVTFFFFKKYCISKLKVDFVIANSADSVEMHATFQLGLRCLPKYPLYYLVVSRLA